MSHARTSSEIEALRGLRATGAEFQNAIDDVALNLFVQIEIERQTHQAVTEPFGYRTISRPAAELPANEGNVQRLVVKDRLDMMPAQMSDLTLARFRAAATASEQPVPVVENQLHPYLHEQREENQVTGYAFFFASSL
jgi:hypothetical protein